MTFVYRKIFITCYNSNNKSESKVYFDLFQLKLRNKMQHILKECIIKLIIHSRCFKIGILDSCRTKIKNGGD